MVCPFPFLGGILQQAAVCGGEAWRVKRGAPGPQDGKETEGEKSGEKEKSS